MQVSVFEKGEDALKEFQSAKYDIGFLDIQMPGMTGLDVANRVLQGPGTHRPKLVAISASVLTHEQSKYFEIGFDALVPKPFRFEQICESLTDLLQVEFEYEAETPAAPGTKLLSESADIELPMDLWKRLRHAAEMYSVTEFETHLTEVSALGDVGRILAERLRELSRNVQIDEILKALDGVRTRP